jgi:hypothetical protein
VVSLSFNPKLASNATPANTANTIHTVLRLPTYASIILAALVPSSPAGTLVTNATESFAYRYARAEKEDLVRLARNWFWKMEKEMLTPRVAPRKWENVVFVTVLAKLVMVPVVAKLMPSVSAFALTVTDCEAMWRLEYAIPIPEPEKTAATQTTTDLSRVIRTMSATPRVMKDQDIHIAGRTSFGDLVRRK